MNINRNTVATLQSGQTLYHKTKRNRDGSPLRARVNGKVKTWKTRPEDFRVPMKYGLRDCFYITPTNAIDWTTNETVAACKLCRDWEKLGEQTCIQHEAMKI